MRFKNKWKLYEWIDKHPRSLFMECVDAMGWSIKKTSKYLNQLLKDSIIKTEFEIMDDSIWGEKTWYYYPKSLKELIYDGKRMEYNTNKTQQ